MHVKVVYDLLCNIWAKVATIWGTSPTKILYRRYLNRRPNPNYPNDPFNPQSQLDQLFCVFMTNKNKLSETSFDTYSHSKMFKLLNVIKFNMQDALRYLGKVIFLLPQAKVQTQPKINKTRLI